VRATVRAVGTCASDVVFVREADFFFYVGVFLFGQSRPWIAARRKEEKETKLDSFTFVHEQVDGRFQQEGVQEFAHFCTFPSLAAELLLLSSTSTSFFPTTVVFIRK